MKNKAKFITLSLFVLGVLGCSSAPVSPTREVASSGGILAELLQKTVHSTGKSDSEVIREMGRLLQSKSMIRHDVDYGAIREIEDLKSKIGGLQFENEAFRIIRQNSDYFASRLEVDASVMTKTFDEAAEASGRYGEISVDKNAFENLPVIPAKITEKAASVQVFKHKVWKNYNKATLADYIKATEKLYSVKIQHSIQDKMLSTNIHLFIDGPPLNAQLASDELYNIINVHGAEWGYGGPSYYPWKYIDQLDPKLRPPQRSKYDNGKHWWE